MTTQAQSHSGGAGWLIVLLAIAVVAGLLLILLQQLPTLQDVRYRDHAVQRHGEDALTARDALQQCGQGLRVQLCPPSEKHGLSVVFWCETGRRLCPGCATTIGGLERSTYIKDCEEWRRCQ